MTEAEIKQAFLESLGEIAPEAEPTTLAGGVPLREQLDIDSFDFLRLMVLLHEHLGVDIPERDYGRLGTLDAAVTYLSQKLWSGPVGAR